MEDGEEFLIYSRTYLDLRSEKPKIRLIAFRYCPKSRKENLFLSFRSSNSVRQDLNSSIPPTKRRLKLRIMNYAGGMVCRPHQGCPWVPYFLTTELGSVTSRNISRLVLFRGAAQKRTGSLLKDPIPVGMPVEQENERMHHLAVCVTPLYLYADWLQMVHFLEAWLFLGVSKLWIYVTSVSSDVDSWLNAYEAEGLVERVPWPLLPTNKRTDPNKGIFRMGQFAAQNDCVLRSVGLAKFVALVDFDDFIIPQAPNVSLTMVLDELAKRFPTAAGFSFRQKGRLLYPKHYQIPGNVLLSRLNFAHLTQLRLADQQRNFAHKKLIFRPERVHMILTHSLRTLLHGYS